MHKLYVGILAFLCCVSPNPTMAGESPEKLWRVLTLLAPQLSGRFGNCDLSTEQYPGKSPLRWLKLNIKSGDKATYIFFGLSPIVTSVIPLPTHGKEFSNLYRLVGDFSYFNERPGERPLLKKLVKQIVEVDFEGTSGKVLNIKSHVSFRPVDAIDPFKANLFKRILIPEETIDCLN